jgi:SAM-dependent methyltransferase
MDFVGGVMFKEIGHALVEKFITLGGLQPHHRVLDVGCGIGRIAGPLTQYLDAQGSYEGFDIVKMGIDWCNEKIAPRYRNFRFQLVDISNSQYNPGGAGSACGFRFPYEPGSFDFVCLTSVFTHMQRAPFECYLGEIARVLKVGGRCFVTFFVLNQESLQLIKAGKSQFLFPIACDDYSAVEFRENPDAMVGYREEYLHAEFQRRGLRPEGPIQYGNWCGRVSSEYQDIIIAKKEPNTATNGSDWKKHVKRNMLRPIRSGLGRVLKRDGRAEGGAAEGGRISALLTGGGEGMVKTARGTAALARRALRSLRVLRASPANRPDPTRPHPSLVERFVRAGANTPDKPPAYLRRYDRLFATLSNARILELGVYRGHSLRLWAELPHFSLVAGVDLQTPADANFPPKVRFYQGSQTDLSLLSRVASECGPFDIIVDDCSHLRAETEASFEMLFPHLKAHGHYIIEDIAAFQDGASIREVGPAGITTGLVGYTKQLLDRTVPTAIGIGLSPFEEMTFYPNMVVITKAQQPGCNHVS